MVNLRKFMFKKFVPQIAQIFTNLCSKNMSHKMHKFSQIYVQKISPTNCTNFHKFMFKKYLPQIAQIFTNLCSKNMSHKMHKFSQIYVQKICPTNCTNFHKFYCAFLCFLQTPLVVCFLRHGMLCYHMGG